LSSDRQSTLPETIDAGKYERVSFANRAGRAINVELFGAGFLAL
jgi:hypothetical protein